MRLPIPAGPALLSPGVYVTVTGQSWGECSRHSVPSLRDRDHAPRLPGLGLALLLCPLWDLH